MNDSKQDLEKKAAAEAAAELVSDGMTVGLGTGSTVAFLLPAIAERGVKDLRCVATSVLPRSGRASWGSRSRSSTRSSGWTSRSTAPTRSRPTAGWSRAAAAPIPARRSSPPRPSASSSSPTPRRPWTRIAAPIPLELHAFGLASTLARLNAELGEVAPRPDAPPSPDGGVIADYAGEVGDPGELAAALAAVPGVVDHGLFPASMVSEVLVGRGDGVERA